MLTLQRNSDQARDRYGRNHILSSLPRAEYEGLLPALTPVRLNKGEVLYEAGSPVRDCFFPTSAVFSLLLSTEAGDVIEVGMIGNEGMVGLPAVLHAVEVPYRVVARADGEALKIGGRVVQERACHGTALHALLLRYVHRLLFQVSQSVLCNRFHLTEKRLCRWLLASSDRSQSDTFCLTQETIANMLGVPRTNVTMIMCGLQRKSLVSYTRGRITITDRRGMEAAACECYEMGRNEGRAAFG
ncbi:MAG TPA: Crp/Fnr family transcriptional regulator [Pyrinomonadaceae bacterium]|nr:Crp/Fnr family transcriptional regulator [Pyrinomonadaceae bacterium]